MKEIRIPLTAAGIRKAIEELNRIRDNLDAEVGQIVERLAVEGAAEAQNAYGRMASAEGSREGNTGKITASGKSVIIAEFGAGFATMEDHPMAGEAPVTIAKGEYSRVNEGQFWRMLQAGTPDPHWVFGGRPYNRVDARHGLLNAHEYIVNNYERIAGEVLLRD